MSGTTLYPRPPLSTLERARTRAQATSSRTCLVRVVRKTAARAHTVLGWSPGGGWDASPLPRRLSPPPCAWPPATPLPHCSGTPALIRSEPTIFGRGLRTPALVCWRRLRSLPVDRARGGEAPLPRRTLGGLGGRSGANLGARPLGLERPFCRWPRPLPPRPSRVRPRLRPFFPLFSLSLSSRRDQSSCLVWAAGVPSHSLREPGFTRGLPLPLSPFPSSPGTPVPPLGATSAPAYVGSVRASRVPLQPVGLGGEADYRHPWGESRPLRCETATFSPPLSPSALPVPRRAHSLRGRTRWCVRHLGSPPGPREGGERAPLAAPPVSAPRGGRPRARPLGRLSAACPGCEGGDARQPGPRACGWDREVHPPLRARGSGLPPLPLAPPHPHSLA